MIIVVDDGSTDNTGKILQKYRDKIKIIEQKNSGIATTRNKGLEIATGKYIAFVDSDDYIETKYLSDLLAGINGELVISNVNYCSEDLKQKMSQEKKGTYCIMLKEEPDQIADLLKKRKLNYVYAKLYRNDLVLDFNIRFHEDVSLGEDTMFVFDYLLHTNKISVIDSSNYNYIKYGIGTLSSSFYWDIYSRYCMLNDYLESFISTMQIDNPMIQEVL